MYVISLQYSSLPLLRVVTDMLCRFWSARFEARSPTVPKRPTHLSPSRTPRTSCSSTPRVLLYSSHRNGAGSCGTAASTSQPSRRRLHPFPEPQGLSSLSWQGNDQRKKSPCRVPPSSKTRSDTQESWRRSCRVITSYYCCCCLAIRLLSCFRFLLFRSSSA